MSRRNDSQRAIDEYLDKRFPGAMKGTSRITPARAKVFGLVARGMQPVEIAARLGLARKTVTNHCDALRERLNIDSFVNLYAFAALYVAYQYAFPPRIKVLSGAK